MNVESAIHPRLTDSYQWRNMHSKRTQMPDNPMNALITRFLTDSYGHRKMQI